MALDRAPLISVIVATNRSGPYLEEALASVAAQTYPAVELIVVDDGSPEADAVQAAAAGVRGAAVVRQESLGVAIARNRGVALASGDFLAFLDDDDVWHPERLAVQAAHLQERPDAVAGYCGMQTIDSLGRVLVEADQFEVADRFGIARRLTGIILPNLMIRREAFSAVGGFHPGFRLAEDLDLVLRLGERGPFVFDSRALVGYRAHGSNTTRRHRELTRSIDRVLRLHRWSAQERGDAQLVAAFDDSLRRNYRFAWWGAGRSARAALSARKPAAAASELLWALKTAPRGLLDGLLRRVGRAR